MMTVRIKTANEAFQDGNKADACADILLAVIEQLRNGWMQGPCMDVNGNKVGTWELT